MFIGLGIAVAASIAVGVGLDLVSAALPQAQQEMLETVIGGIAVVFVTTMIIWMNRNAFHLKGELERDAAQAINTGGSLALAVMAFLAVLKEGFETAVFLLAAVQATHGSHWSAAAGGVAGIAVAVGIGVGLYFGALKVNLGRFFRITGIFLVFIAAGLVMSSLRTAHEAGWITIGQQKVADLSSWMSARSVFGALITGMFGIPTDPRLIEVVGWSLYAVPVLLVFLWPARLTPTATGRRRVLAGVATSLAAAAVVPAVAIPAGAVGSGPVMRTVTDAGGQRLSVAVASTGAGRSLVITPSTPGASAQSIPLADAGSQTVGGVDVAVWQAKVSTDPGQTAATVTLAQLARLTGGRLPVGLSPSRTPGPFTATWSASIAYTAVTRGEVVVSANATGARLANLTGGGLSAPKTVSVGGLDGDWATVQTEDQAIPAQIAQSARDRTERTLWRVWLPVVLAVAAVGTAVSALRTGRRAVPDERKQQNDDAADRRDEIGVP